MSALPNITPLTSMYEAYLAAGFALVPIASGKGPTTPGWNRKENAVRTKDRLDPTVGYGLAHAWSAPVTCALDIDNIHASIDLLSDHDVSLQSLMDAPDSVMIDSGNPGHAKLIYTLPFGLTLPSKKVNYTASDESKQVAFELRCASSNGLTLQDVLPSAINHPVSGRPYRWSGNGHFSKLPIIPMAVLDLWQSMITEEDAQQVTTDTIPATWAELRTALYTIPADCPREEWLTALMALHHAGTQIEQVDQAQALAHEWSATGTLKYKGVHDFQAVWRSIKADSNGIKTGSLFHTAQKYGYKRPLPDVKQLFKSVIPMSPVQLIDTMRMPMPDMDLELWPPLLAQTVTEVAASVGCDPLVPLWAGLGAVCGVVDSQIRLELMPGFAVPPILWLMTVGDPGDKKSPGARPMLHVLRQLENEDRKRYSRALVEWEALDHVYQTSRKAYMTAAAQNTGTVLTGKLDNDSLPPVAGEGPAKPVDLRLVVDDVTSQKLVRLVADRPRGMLCHLDEMASWVNKLTDPRSGEDRSCWTKSYESDPYTMDRVGLTDTLFVKNMAVSIFGNIQPQVFKAKYKAMADDGLLQRFIPACLRPDMTKRGDPIPAHLSSLPAWEMRLRELFTLPSITYRLDSGAYESYRDFQSWYETNKQDERLLKAGSVYMQAYGKLEGTCGRIALVMHLINDPYTSVVPKATMDKAIQICRQYLIPAYRYSLGETAGLTELSLDKWCADKVIQLSGSDKTTISMADIRRGGGNAVRDIPRHNLDQQICDAMEPLEIAQWVTVINDHSHKKVWAINPHLATQYADIKLKVILAKQRRMDEVYQNIVKTGRYVNPKRQIVNGYDPETMDGKYQ